MKWITIMVATIATLTSCSDMKTETIQVGENTFVHNEKVYRIIDNEITELGNLLTDSLSKSIVLNPNLKEYGELELDYIKEGANSTLNAVYRGDILYYKMEIEGLNDLREKYSDGGLTINFEDEYDFQIHSTTLEINELVRIVDSNNKTVMFQYNGKTQMSSEVYRAISRYSVSSFLRKKSKYGW